MNPDRIYRQYRDDALAHQIDAKEYSTFVAMPFGEIFSYHSRDIFTDVIQVAASEASKRGENKRKFSAPMRIDDEPGVAGVITEDIIVKILESHLFLADLTFENPGVILEVGVALGLKPNKQIILILQGDPHTLHFDIRNNRVIRYYQKESINIISDALIAGAKEFESDCKLYIESITKTLSSSAIICLNSYGQLYHANPKNSLHRGNRGSHFNGDNGIILFDIATRELLLRRLLWSDYKVRQNPTGDQFGMYATELGWRVIEHMWPNLRRSQGDAV